MSQSIINGLQLSNDGTVFRSDFTFDQGQYTHWISPFKWVCINPDGSAHAFNVRPDPVEFLDCKKWTLGVHCMSDSFREIDVTVVNHCGMNDDNWNTMIYSTDHDGVFRRFIGWKATGEEIDVRFPNGEKFDPIIYIPLKKNRIFLV